MNYMHRRRSHEFGIVEYIILAVILLVVLVLTWPWWAYLVGAVCVLVLIFNKTLRARIISAFSQEEVDSGATRLRYWMLVALTAAGALSALVCLFAASDLQWWLISLGCFIPALRLYAMGCGSRSWPRLQRALCDNLLEIALIAFLVLASFTLALGHYRSLPLDGMTLRELRELQHGIVEKHEWLESHKLGFFSLLAFLAAMILLRIAAHLNPRLEGRVSVTSKALVGSVKWWERASCAAAFAASFTFLGTGQGGQVYEPVSLSLKDAQKNYDTFRAKVTEHVEFVLRRDLVTKSLENAPPVVLVEIRQAIDFREQRDRLDNERSVAEAVFQIKTDETEPFPKRALLYRDAVTTNSFAGAPKHAPLSSTPAGLRKRREAAERVAGEDKIREVEYHLKREREEKKNEDIDEMAKETIEGLPIADLIFAKVTVLDVLKLHYPVLGEFLDAISSSVSEASFDAIRDSIAGKVEDECVDSCDGIAQATLKETQAANQQAAYLEDRFNTQWAVDTRERLDNYVVEIHAEESTLREQAVEKNAERIARAYHDASATVDMIDRVAIETKSASLQKQAATMRDLLTQLKDASRDFPLFTMAGPEQQKILDVLKMRGGQQSAYIYLDAGAWKTPLDGIQKCNAAGELELSRLAGSSVLMPEEEAKLRAAMGDKFDPLRQRGIEEHDKEQRRMFERRGEYDHPEVDHPVEHPVL
jgi:hypothetical protein